MIDQPQIQMKELNKHYGQFHALHNINLDIAKGSFVALVGPSGCGKSTLLRTIAGLEHISSGEISIDGQQVNDMPPRKRDIAMVFQSYALYPHMNVRDNLTYSLRLNRVPKAERGKAANEVAVSIGLEGLLDRFPRELSGGQRQRVAMGRAIMRNPKAFLFDEPLSNLDASLRVQMRKEIRALHNRLGATSVYVTHDQIEAMTMADVVVVLRDGLIEQVGSPLELFDAPVNKFVAGFIGSPAMNFLAGEICQDGKHVQLDMDKDVAFELAGEHEPGRRVIAGIRPENFKVVQGIKGGLKVKVLVVEHLGTTSMITTEPNPELTVVEHGRCSYKTGDLVSLTVAPERISLFDESKEIAI